MTARMPEDFPASYVDWNHVTSMGTALPPRDPDDDDDDDDDAEDEDEEDEPAVVREPDE
jgi:hypothetical protein